MYVQVKRIIEKENKLGKDFVLFIGFLIEWRVIWMWGQP